VIYDVSKFVEYPGFNVKPADDTVDVRLAVCVQAHSIGYCNVHALLSGCVESVNLEVGSTFNHILRVECYKFQYWQHNKHTKFSLPIFLWKTWIFYPVFFWYSNSGICSV
jgi:hypothetical protein